jgi:ABC-type nitrate/sulfonate/bicarbonate transport system substrate-binding protein
MQIPSESYAPLFIAQDSGLFKKQHLNVTIIPDAGSNADSLLSAGKADIALNAAVTSLLIAQKGQPIKLLYNQYNAQLGSLVGNLNVKTLAGAEGLKECKLAAPPAGSLGYYSAIYYVQKLHLNCSVTPFSSEPLEISAMRSGGYQLGELATTVAIQEAAAKEVTDIVNPALPQYQSLQLPQVPVAIYCGVQSNLAKKRDAVVSFFKAILLATNAMDRETDEATARIIARDPAFAGISLSVVQQQFEAVKAYISNGPGAGDISEALWTRALNNYPEWGVAGYKAGDTANEYSHVIDMSYYRSAKSAVR